MKRKIVMEMIRKINWMNMGCCFGYMVMFAQIVIHPDGDYRYIALITTAALAALMGIFGLFGWKLRELHGAWYEDE